MRQAKAVSQLEESVLQDDVPFQMDHAQVPQYFLGENDVRRFSPTFLCFSILEFFCFVRIYWHRIPISISFSATIPWIPCGWEIFWRRKIIGPKKMGIANVIGSMYGIFTYICLFLMVKYGKCR